MNTQKTIFITSFQGLISRVLQCGVLDYLLESGNMRIVLLVPDFKKEYFEKTFQHPHIFIEGIPDSVLLHRTHIFNNLTFPLLHTKGMSMKRISYRYFTSWPRYLLHQGTAMFLGRLRFIRNLFRKINYYFSGPSVLDKYFEKYQPDLVLSMDIKHKMDTQFVIEAKKRHIKTVGMVRSWDYLTAKGIIRVKPDKMIVHNDIIKKEAIKYADMKEKDITVVGIPHFDPYVNEKRISREEFFEHIGADPDKRLLLYAPVGSKFGNTDGEIVDVLAENIEKSTLPKDLQILVRIPPGDTIETAGFKKRPFVYFDEPGRIFGNRHRKANEMTYDDLLHLANSIYYSDAVLSSPSTMVIDAAVFNKPIIGVGFEGRQKKAYTDSFIRGWSSDHMKNVIKTGGVRVAYTADNCIRLIEMFLEDPSIDMDKRARIVEEQCGKFDGKASKRLADAVLNMLH